MPPKSVPSDHLQFCNNIGAIRESPLRDSLSKFPSKKSPKSAKKLQKGIAIWILLCYNIPAVRSDARKILLRDGPLQARMNVL